MTTLGERVKAERRAKGWSQVELAQRVTRAGYSIRQGGIAQIERRGDTEPKSIVQLAQALRCRSTGCKATAATRCRACPARRPLSLVLGPSRRRPIGEAAPVPAAPLQVFASAEGGTDGAMILSNEPVAWIPRDTRLDGIREAYGCFVSGDSMDPAYERGNLLLVNPTAAPGRATTACSCARLPTARAMPWSSAWCGATPTAGR